MPTFEPWDIIKVPFPYTDRPVRERRPALVVGTKNIEENHGLLMITSAENRGWSGDVEVTDLLLAGLPVSSVVRTAKIATIETKEAQRIGVLAKVDRVAIGQQVLPILEPMLTTSNL